MMIHADLKSIAEVYMLALEYDPLHPGYALSLAHALELKNDLAGVVASVAAYLRCVESGGPSQVGHLVLGGGLQWKVGGEQCKGHAEEGKQRKARGSGRRVRGSAMEGGKRARGFALEGKRKARSFERRAMQGTCGGERGALQWKMGGEQGARRCG
eukprot:1142260-Pelagomonas_calceolata.AAC.6